MFEQYEYGGGGFFLSGPDIRTATLKEHLVSERYWLEILEKVHVQVDRFRIEVEKQSLKKAE